MQSFVIVSIFVNLNIPPMKRLSIFCIFITLFLTNANSEETFLSDGKTWNYELEEVNV